MPNSMNFAPEARKSAMRGALLVVGAGLMWSFTGLLVRNAPSLDSWQFLAYRSAGLGLAFFLLNHFAGRGSIPLRLFKLGWHGLMASVLMAGAFICYVFAIMNTSVANALFLNSCTPILSALIGFFVLGERLNRGMLAAVMIGLIGLGIMVNGEIGGGNMFGNLMALLPALFFATYSVLIRLRPKEDFSPTISGFAYIVVAVAVTVMLVTGDNLFPRWQEAAVAFFNGFLTMGLGFALFQRGAPRIPAVSQTLLAQSETLLGPVWVWLFLNERPGLNTLIGGGVILVGVILMAYYGAQQEARRVQTVPAVAG